jgi:hypothetical protein
LRGNVSLYSSRQNIAARQCANQLVNVAIPP